MGSNEFCYGCQYLHSEEMGGGNTGGRWRCTKTGHSYVVVGLFGYMSDDLEEDKPRPINECYVKRNGAPPETHQTHQLKPACPWPAPPKEVTEELLAPKKVKVADPLAALDACTS